MDLRTPARWAGLLGGLCWVLRMVLGLAGTSTGVLPNGLFWLGAALLAVALAAAGSELVSKGTVWLQAIVAVAFPLLVASVLEFLHPYGDPQVFDGVFAVFVLVWAVRGLARLRAERPDREPVADEVAPEPRRAQRRREPERTRRTPPQRRLQPQRGGRAARGRSSGSHSSR